MAVTTSRVTITDTPTLVIQNTLTISADTGNRSYLLRRLGDPGSGIQVYLGDADVTPETGFPWFADDPPLAMDLEPTEKLYAVAASGSQEVATIQVGR